MLCLVVDLSIPCTDFRNGHILYKEASRKTGRGDVDFPMCNIANVGAGFHRRILCSISTTGRVEIDPITSCSSPER